MNIAGENLPKKHYYDDPHLYANQKVVVVGTANSAIDAAIAVLDAPDTEAVEDVIDDTVLTKQDVMGNTEIAEDAPGTQQNNSRQYNNLPKLFEWAVK